VASLPYAGETFALLSALAWAVATILFTVPSRRMRPEAMNLFKTTVSAGLLVLVMVLIRGAGGLRLTDTREALYLAVSGILGITVADTLFFWCLNHIGAWRTLVISCLAPPMTALFSGLWLHDPVGGMGVLGMTVALAGVIMAVVAGMRPGQNGLAFTQSGLAAAVLMEVLVVLGIILTKLGTVKTGSMEASMIRIVVAVPGILLVEAFRGRLASVVREATHPAHFSRLLGGTLAGTCVAYLLFIAGIKYANAGVAISLSATAPAFVIPLSAIFLKERVTALAVTGTGLAIVGIILLFVR
jgi:drug/metabolite transporter (DMT)-like permease